MAQLVTFLASDEAADISGQNFVVYGGDIWAMGGFHAVGELHRESMWTPEELADGQGRAVQERILGGAPLRHLLDAGTRLALPVPPSAGSGTSQTGLDEARRRQARDGTAAVASPTTFSSPSSLTSAHVEVDQVVAALRSACR